MRLDELAVLGRAERTNPGVEHLHGLNSRHNLRVHQPSQVPRQMLGEGAPRARIAKDPGFGADKILRSAAFDQI